MARVINSPSGGDFVGPFEPQVFDHLRRELPTDYIIIPNFQLKQRDFDALEYDLVVIAPHALYVIEDKEWYGRLTGDDQEWLLNQTPKKCPLWLVNTKCKVLKSELKALGREIYVAPLLIVPDSTQIHLGGNWGQNTLNLSKAVTWLCDAKRIGSRATNVKPNYQYIEKALLGRIAVRKREARRRVAGYEIVETLYADDVSGEYVARRAHFENDPSRFRVRTWRLERSGTPQAVEKRKAVIRRPTEAVAKIGRHPNLLPVLHFDFIDDENEFFEVTEWSEFGTLHGYLNNPDRNQLTLRERIEIAAGIAAALSEVHAHGVVHRNVCPESIVIGFDHQPRLTDFDRAYIEGNLSVFEETGARRNPAFIAPELANPAAYDFDAASDMYSFGAVLYQLLTDQMAFATPDDAKIAKGRPSAAPSEIRLGIDPRLDELVLQLLRVDDFHKRPTAHEAGAVLRELLNLSDPPQTQIGGRSDSQLIPFEPGSLVDGVWRVDGVLGQGAFSKVYRVFHLDHQKTYAMKLLTSLKDGDLPAHEWRDASKLPSHPNVARIIWMDRLAPPVQTPYVLYEFIDGETIDQYCDGRRRVPWTDIKRIGMELLSGLQAMHAAGMIHRDIKPANILLELPSHRAKLIDFNIATFVGDTSGRAGTPRYCAPDAGKPEWSAEDDLFSFGVVLYELVLHRHPYPNDNPAVGSPYAPGEITPETERLSSELERFLSKAVQSARGDRYHSAAEMRAALQSIEAMYAPRARPVSVGRFPGLTLVAGEEARRNYNPYVSRLLTLFSQARQTNSGTRGLDEIARLTYVPTRLDEKLAPAIASGNFRLVIVTGNAGDGKTAFLQQIEKSFHGRTVVTPLSSGNGAIWTQDGITYQTNYDGSQDEGGESNDDVLARFFAPFEGDQLSALDGGEARLIAINEGRLLDFLAHSRFASRFGGLSQFVLSALEGREQPNRSLLVNLNLRAVTAGDKDSLVERQLAKLVDPLLWRPCEECALKARCPIKHNVDTLRDPASGAETRRRVRRLFELVHLRRRAHITMRDLRSALSWMILRDNGCKDVADLLNRTDSRVTRDLADLYYSEAFAEPEADSAQSLISSELTDERATDRLVRRLREADVGLVNLPPLDRRLDHSPTTAVPWMTYEQRSTEATRILSELWNSSPMAGDGTNLADLLQGRRGMIQRFRRLAYYERRDGGWQEQIPYRSSKMLEDIISLPEGPEKDKARTDFSGSVIDAISLSEGLRNTQISQRFLALRITRIKGAKVRSYRLFPKDSFKVHVPIPSSQAEYVEYAPDFVELASDHGRGPARLKISLDLLEMLELIRSGYRPTAADLQGLFVNLLIFRNELLATHFERLLVTPDDQTFYEIEARGSATGIDLSIAHTESDLVGSDVR